MMVKPNRDKLVDELKELDYQSLATALMYARYYLLYGEDVTKQWVSAVEQSAILEKAYRKGYYDAMERASRMEKFDAERQKGVVMGDEAGFVADFYIEDHFDDYLDEESKG